MAFSQFVCNLIYIFVKTEEMDLDKEETRDVNRAWASDIVLGFLIKGQVR